MTIITGCAGFIGLHLALRLLNDGEVVVGIDNLNDYYDPRLKQARLSLLLAHPNFHFRRCDISEDTEIERIFASFSPKKVVHLAAQAGVRYSLTNPKAYVESNLSGFLSILEACRQNKVHHLVYASSSSVYGLNRKMPFSVHDATNHPASFYAATKRANELMAHSYSHLYALPTTGLRFFTVYGPWYRPDMALYRFSDAIMQGRPIDLYNFGRMKRDFTYVDDVVDGIILALRDAPGSQAQWDAVSPDPSTSSAPYRIYNIGNNSPVELETVVALLEKELGTKAQRNLLPMQPGDVHETYADMDAFAFTPSTPLAEGIAQFVTWYKAYRATSAATIDLEARKILATTS